MDSLSWVGMYFALIVTTFASLATGSKLTCLLGVLLAGVFCSSLIFAFYSNRFRSQTIESRTKNTGEIVYLDTCGHTWFSLLRGILAGASIGVPWFVALYLLSNPVLPVVMSIWTAWVLCINLLFPTRYTITTRGIWTRAGTIHSFVYFEDLENIYREPATRLVWPSDKSNPIVRLSDYIVLSIDPERKLPKESQKKHLTPSDPLEFMNYLPSQLLTRSYKE